ncbi:hypothetical protein EOL73_01905 [Candidatus Saccharibacteria bacterium]|nr:hypothetical protein [Candidatus Saccharibacteria bacterium]NCU40490.1 hypothetical protein [Candidatus Saccharibacteria bacterium]
MQINPQDLNRSIPQKSPSRSRFWSVVGILAVTTLFAGLYFRQNIVDYIVASQFVPSVQLNEVLGSTYLNEKGTFYVYASQTKVVAKDKFNDYCGSLQNEKTIVLGCYSPITKQIVIYDVTDSRLDGVREATTAHEMLHAVWDRLSQDEKTRLTDLLNIEARKVTEQRLKDLFAYYNESDPDVMSNELHSIIGTEIVDISPELEAHYDNYFANRKALVVETKQYEAVFVEIETRQQSILSEMDELSLVITNRSDAYDRNFADLTKEIDLFNSWADSSEATVSEFNRRRNDLLNNIDNLEADQISINSDIERYNLLRQELENLNLLAEDLNRSLDSNIIPMKDTPSL